jgi:hypothetical protein
MWNRWIKTGIVSSLLGMVVYAGAAWADHSWSTYHWARTANPITLMVVDSVSGEWQFEFDTALTEWNVSSVLDMGVADPPDDSSRTRKQCRMVSGQIRICNAAYGFNGWLGLATIGLDSNGHIDRGTAKVNDSYASYWTIVGEKRHVMCQEIGHLFGLGHTSEDGSTQGTCMDYSMDLNSISPNQHDYDLLVAKYTHLDSYNSYDGGASGADSGGCTAPPGKGCNKNRADVGLGPDGSPPMGVRVHRGRFKEIWVAPRPDGGLWIHHIRLVPEEFRDVR